MRNLTALLFLLSLCSLHLVFSAPPSLDHLTGCCPVTTKIRIPLKNIVDYWQTSSCPIKAIVFETLNNGDTFKWCVDPTASWASRHMKSVDRKNKNKS